jgi:hypothetical protein
VKYWELIADNLPDAGWSLDCVSAVDSRGQTIWIADAHRDNGKRFVVRADEILTAFLELERGIHEFAVSLVITSLLSEIALCSSVSITTATKVPIRAIPMDD